MISPLNDEFPTTICDHYQRLYGVTESYDSVNQSLWGGADVLTAYTPRRDTMEGEF